MEPDDPTRWDPEVEKLQRELDTVERRIADDRAEVLPLKTKSHSDIPISLRLWHSRGPDV